MADTIKNSVSIYRRTVIPMQVCIIGLCAMLLYRHTPVLGVLLGFIVMEIFAFLGALWGARLQRKVQDGRSARAPQMLGGRGIR